MKNQIFSLLALMMFSQAGLAKVKYQYCYKDYDYTTACSEFRDSAIVAQEESYNRCMARFSWWGCNALNAKVLETKEFEEDKPEAVSTPTPTPTSTSPSTTTSTSTYTGTLPPVQMTLNLASKAEITYTGMKRADGERLTSDDQRNFGDRRDAVQSVVLSALLQGGTTTTILKNVELQEQEVNDRSKFLVTLTLEAADFSQQVKIETFDGTYASDLKAAVANGWLTWGLCWINKAHIETIITDDVAKEQIHIDAMSCLP